MSKISISVLVFFLGLAGYLGFTGFTRLESDINEVKKMAASVAWPTADAVITSSSVTTGKASKGRQTFKPKVAYSYSVNGRACEGERMAFSNALDGVAKNQEVAETIAGRFPVGSKHKAHYSPDKVEEAVLVPGVEPNRLFLPSIMNIVGAFALIPFTVAFYFLRMRSGATLMHRLLFVFAIGVIFVCSMLLESFVKNSIVSSLVPGKSILHLEEDGYLVDGKKFPY